MIEPTIGRRIWYWPDADLQYAQLDKAQAFDAGVIFVHGSNYVTLSVTMHTGTVTTKYNVEITEEQIPGCAQWMPFQKKVAEAEAEAEQDSVDPDPIPC